MTKTEDFSGIRGDHSIIFRDQGGTDCPPPPPVGPLFYIIHKATFAVKSGAFPGVFFVKSSVTKVDGCNFKILTGMKSK